MSTNFGKGLVSLFNWRKGDVLPLFVANRIEIPAVAFGTLWAGGIVSLCNPAYTTTELTHQLKGSGARAIVTQLAVIDTVRAACRAVGIPEDHIILLGADLDPNGRHKHWTNVRNISGTQRYRQVKIYPKSDTAFLVNSSGSTEKPKGVMLSHYNLTSNVVQIQPSQQFNLTWDGSKTSGSIPLPPQRHGDKVLACLPFFHIYGLTMFVLCPQYTGVTTLVMARFDIDRWCSMVQKNKATYAYIVPPIAVLLAEHPTVTAYDLNSLRMTNSGGAPLNRELVETVFKRTGVRIKQGCGLSETSPGVCHQRCGTTGFPALAV
jgi:4-coumarate--CoA ligase